MQNTSRYHQKRENWIMSSNNPPKSQPFIFPKKKLKKKMKGVRVSPHVPFPSFLSAAATYSYSCRRGHRASWPRPPPYPLFFISTAPPTFEKFTETPLNLQNIKAHENSKSASSTNPSSDPIARLVLEIGIPRAQSIDRDPFPR